VLAFLAACSWAQQQNAATDQGAQQSSVTARSPDSTAEDQAVPLCTVNLADRQKTIEVSDEVKQGRTPPRVIHLVNPQFTDQARRAFKKKHIRAFDDTVLIGLIVDEQGEVRARDHGRQTCTRQNHRRSALQALLVAFFAPGKELWKPSAKAARLPKCS
jgi:hypothetical protein